MDTVSTYSELLTLPLSVVPKAYRSNLCLKINLNLLQQGYAHLLSVAAVLEPDKCDVIGGDKSWLSRGDVSDDGSQVCFVQMYLRQQKSFRILNETWLRRMCPSMRTGVS